MVAGCLTPEERAVYETFKQVFLSRLRQRIEAPRVVVVTDLAKDYDDLAAMLVLKELHRLKIINLLGFVANLEPAMQRARFGRGALDLLDLGYIPIAAGTSGLPRSLDEKHKVHDYEFDCPFMADEEFPEDGKTLLDRFGDEHYETGKNFTLVLLSSLKDISMFAEREYFLSNHLSNVILQGDYAMSAEGNLVPDSGAANNRFDMESAKSFHTFMQEEKIPSVVYTKVAAFATPLTSELFAELAETQHPLGQHLRKVQLAQDLVFYQAASKKDPAKRYAPFMDQEWFLKNKTSWFDKGFPSDTPYPKGEEVIPYLDKLVLYDALAALGSCGADALDALNVLTPPKDQSIHRVVGLKGPPSDPGINPEQMAIVLSALLKGSLLNCSYTKSLRRLQAVDQSIKNPTRLFDRMRAGMFRHL